MGDPEVDVLSSYGRNGASDAAASEIESENFVRADGGEDEMVKATEVRLRFEVGAVGKFGIDEDVEVEGAVRSRHAAEIPV